MRRVLEGGVGWESGGGMLEMSMEREGRDEGREERLAWKEGEEDSEC